MLISFNPGPFRGPRKGIGMRAAAADCESRILTPPTRGNSSFFFLFSSIARPGFASKTPLSRNFSYDGHQPGEGGGAEPPLVISDHPANAQENGPIIHRQPGDYSRFRQSAKDEGRKILASNDAENSAPTFLWQTMLMQSRVALLFL